MDKKDSEYMRKNHRKIVRGVVEETAEVTTKFFWFAMGMLVAAGLVLVLDWLASHVPQTY